MAYDKKIASKVDTVEDEEIVNDDLEALKTGQLQTIWNLMWKNVVWCTAEDLTETLITNFVSKNYKLQSLKKDLGVIVNSEMKFKDHVASAAKKANKTLGMIKRNFEYVNKVAFEVLYGSLVRPQLECTVHISHWFERKIRYVTKKSNEVD